MNNDSIDKLTEKATQLIDYEGKDPSIFYEHYVTLRSFSDRRIVCHGKNPNKVLEETEKAKGIKNPVLHYILNPKKTYSYISPKSGKKHVYASPKK